MITVQNKPYLTQHLEQIQTLLTFSLFLSSFPPPAALSTSLSHVRAKNEREEVWYLKSTFIDI